MSDKYEPTLVEWDELVMLWGRSKVVHETSYESRIAWTTKTFVAAHPDVLHRDVYLWLEKNLEIAQGSSPSMVRSTPWHDEITAVHRRPPRGTPSAEACISPIGDRVAAGPGQRRS